MSQDVSSCQYWLQLCCACVLDEWAAVVALILMLLCAGVRHATYRRLWHKIHLVGAGRDE